MVHFAKGRSLPQAPPYRRSPNPLGLAMHAMRSKVLACFETGVRKNPKLRGHIVIRFVIDRDGSAMFACDAGSDLPDHDVVACAVRSMGQIAFPVPEGGRMNVVYPIALGLED
jgi:hypothetical protein